MKQDKDGGITLGNTPEGYAPFHNDLDFEEQTPLDSTSEAEEESDPYLVEKIVAKRFRNNQYEYLIKWCGYGEKDNTWELHTNIPNNILTDYERNLTTTTSSTSRPRREGLRQCKKSTYSDDFINNM